MNPFHIRAEIKSDQTQIFEVEEAAFGQAGQAHLVNALRSASRPFISLVAENSSGIIGHVSFSPVSFAAQGGPAACQLSPLAVLPAYQKHGVGSALVAAGLEACAQTGWKAVFLLGDPRYYARFGFKLASDRLLVNSGPDGKYLQYVEIEADVLASISGEVHFHPVFKNFE